MNAVTLPIIIAAAIIVGALIGAKLTVKGYEAQKPLFIEAGYACFDFGYRFAKAEDQGASTTELLAMIDEETTRIKNLFKM